MADELVFDIEANDNASDDIRRVQSEIRKTGDTTNSTGQAFSGASKQSTGLASNLGKVAKFAAAAGVAFVGIQKAGEFIWSANEAAQEFAVTAGDMTQAIKNTGVEGQELDRIFQNVTGTANDFAQVAGTRVPEMQQAFIQLTTQLGNAEQASDQLDRVLGLMNLTGKESTDVAKSLGQALTGDFGPMKEIGILTDAQIQKFKGMADQGEAVNLMLEVLDGKIEGFAEGLPEASVQTDRIASNFERFKAAIGGVIDVSPGLVLVGDLSEELAKQAEAVATEWRKSARSIGQELESIQRAAKDTNREIEKISTDQTRAELARERVGLFERELETAKLIREEQVALGNLSRVDADFQISLLEKQLAQKKEVLLADAGIFERREEQLDFEVQIAQKELELLKAKTDRDRARLQLQVDFLKVQEEFNNKIAQASNEEEKQKLEMFEQIELENLQIENAQALRDIRSRERDDQMKHRDELADKEQENFEAQLDRMAQATERRVTLFQEANSAFIAEMAESVRRSQEIADAAMESGSFSGEDDEPSLDEEEANIRASGEAKRIGKFATVSGGLGAGLGESRSIFESSLEDGEVMNETLEEQLALWGGLSDATASFGDNLAELAENQWDFKDAAGATLGAIDAITQAGGAMAGALTDSTQEAAGIQAVFEFAAAAGALALGLTWGGPNFFAAAIQHGIAGASYLSVAAGGGGGKPASGGASAGGGGGGGGGGAMNVNIDAEREKTARAIAEAIEGQNQAQGLTINLDLGSNNVIPTESTAFGRILTDQLEDAAQNIVGLNVGR